MKQVVFIGLLLLSAMRIAGQAQNVDSLVNVLETQKLSAEEQLDLYYEISNAYRPQDAESTIKYSKLGLVLAEKEKDYGKASRFNQYLGMSYDVLYMRDSAFIFLDKAKEYVINSISVAESYGNVLLIANAWSTLSAIYFKQNHYIESEEAILKAWELDSINTVIGINAIPNLVKSNIMLDNKDKAIRGKNK